MKKILFISVILFLGININAQTNTTQYKVIKKIHVAGDGGWDFLTPSANCVLLISNNLKLKSSLLKDKDFEIY